MAKNNFLTDKFTTLGGLAAVAYGSSLSFGTVGDQIKINSITRSLDQQLPSNVLLDFIGTKTVFIDAFKVVFQSEYEKIGPFTDFIDIHSSIDSFANLCLEEFLKDLDTQSTYSISFSSMLEVAIRNAYRREKGRPEIGVDIEELSNLVIAEMTSLEYLGQDIETLILLASNNPNTKITSVTPDTTIPLSPEPPLEKDSRGVERNYGTISPTDYYNGVGFLKEGDSIRKSVLQGYVGYPLVALLGESLLNPDSYDNLSLSDTNGSLLSELNNNSEIPASEQGIYNLNLARIDLGN